MKLYSLNKSILSKEVFGNFQSDDIDNFLVIEKFSDGEYCPIFKHSIRDEEIYLMADGHSSNDIIKLLLTIDACKRSGSGNISVIMPYLPYSRSDKNDHVRQSISAKVIADLLTNSGINKLITIDLHNSSIQGVYNMPVIHLFSTKIFTSYIDSLKLENLCFLSPDHGATQRTLKFARFFSDSTIAVIDKKRLKPNEVSSMRLLNPVEGKNVIITDDLGDTMSTLCKAAQLAIDNGALSVRGVLTHPVLSGQSLTTISKSPLKEIIVSDTIPSVYEKREIYGLMDVYNKPKFTIVSCSNLLANSVDKLIKHESISEINL